MHKEAGARTASFIGRLSDFFRSDFARIAFLSLVALPLVSCLHADPVPKLRDPRNSEALRRDRVAEFEEQRRATGSSLHGFPARSLSTVEMATIFPFPSQPDIALPPLQGRKPARENGDQFRPPALPVSDRTPVLEILKYGKVIASLEAPAGKRLAVHCGDDAIIHIVICTADAGTSIATGVIDIIDALNAPAQWRYCENGNEVMLTGTGYDIGGYSIRLAYFSGQNGINPFF